MWDKQGGNTRSKALHQIHDSSYRSVGISFKCAENVQLHFVFCFYWFIFFLVLLLFISSVLLIHETFVDWSKNLKLAPYKPKSSLIHKNWVTVGGWPVKFHFITCTVRVCIIKTWSRHFCTALACINFNWNSRGHLKGFCAIYNKDAEHKYANYWISVQCVDYYGAPICCEASFMKICFRRREMLIFFLVFDLFKFD